jgi:tetratricopeptide (TPR) repeat protein
MACRVNIDGPARGFQRALITIRVQENPSSVTSWLNMSPWHRDGPQVRRAHVRPLTLALALLLSLSPAASAQTTEAVQATTAALRAGDFAQAVERSRAALQQAAGDPQLWTLNGLALANLGKRTEALQSFQRALAIDPNYLAALQGASQAHYEAGSRRAVPLLTRILRLQPDNQTAHAMLAVLEYRDGNCRAAITHFEKAGTLIETQIEALHAHATCLVRLQQMDAAIGVLQRTIALEPESSRQRKLLAAVQLMARKPPDAIATLTPLLEGSRADAETLGLASTAYEKSGDTPRAVSTLRQAILLEPRNVDLYLDFANIAFAHQSFQVGIEVLGDGLGLLPSAAPLYVARGVLYVQLADYDRAEADFARASELDPNQALSDAAQGLAAAQEQDLDRALATIQAKLARKPKDAYLLYLHADLLSQKGAEPGTPEFTSALASARKAVALQPGLAPARGVLAKLHLQAGRYREAIEQCRRALAIDPNDQTALYRLIQALRKSGDKSDIPALLKRLAAVREQAAKEERERYRYKLVLGNP